MYEQVAPLDRPLPPGEGRGEGSVKARDTLDHHWTLFLPEPPSAELAVTKPLPDLRLGQSSDSCAGNGRGQRLRHACGNATLTAEWLIAATPHPNPLPPAQADPPAAFS